MSADAKPARTSPTSQPLTATELVELLNQMANRPYDTEGSLVPEEVVDERTHALQAAELALTSGADDELVLAAALHDVGRAEQVRRMYPNLPHEVAGGAFARDRLTERIAWVIEQHVPAKRYLVATDPNYRSLLSPTSVTTLGLQGGPMSPAEVIRFEGHPWHGQAVILRRWDDQAKDPSRPGITMDELAAVHHRWASSVRR
ncbi:HD domain-containing protein [Actinopolymorpha pittospori]|uniref:Gamma-butyrobetaine dioxygenase n=1 Tax=Actinopolymorpha pittospori TaxID=648752 RepID=A0A927RGH0_9ACTN|nr:HD domain-containing protein [Actinopolymorpha pittospori]MBE1604216.1 gamma-butyrobetaine dioxygenase [Actinopolymorpha pittospori]